MSQNHQVKMSPRLTWPIPVVTKQQGSGHDQPKGLDDDIGNAQPWLPYQGYCQQIGLLCQNRQPAPQTPEMIMALNGAVFPGIGGRVGCRVADTLACEDPGSVISSAAISSRRYPRRSVPAPDGHSAPRHCV